MWPNAQFPADLVTFTEEILNGKFHFLSSVSSKRVKEPEIPSKLTLKNPASKLTKESMLKVLAIYVWKTIVTHSYTT